MHGHTARKRFGQNFLADPHYVDAHRRRRRPAARREHRRDRAGPGRAHRRAHRARGPHHGDRNRPRPRGAAARDIHAGATHAARGRRARLRLRSARRRPAHRRQPAVQHQLAAAVPPRRIRRRAARPARDAATGGRGADDGRAGHRRLRPADGDAAGEVSRSRACSSCRPARSGRRRRSIRPSRGWCRSAAAKPHIADAALFARVVAAAFGQRRKTLRNALSAICDEAALRRMRHRSRRVRGETLPVGDFVRISNALAAR